jgi:hypothetical protein
MGFGLSGVLGYSVMGDLEADRRGREYLRLENDWERFSYSVPHSGYGWGMEIRLVTSGGYWAALGFGQLRGNGSFRMIDTLYGQTPQGAYDLDQSVDVYAIPLTLTLGATLPTRFANLYGGVGAGLYYGDMSVLRQEEYEEPGFSWTADMEADMSSGAMGGHLMGGAEVYIAPSLALYGAGLLRYAKLPSLSGSMTYEYWDSNWNVYYLDQKAYATMNECPGSSSEEYMSIEAESPDGDERGMDIDFSGVVFEVGLRYYVPLGF